MDAGEFDVTFTMELLREIFADGLALGGVAWVRAAGFCVCRPKRVDVVGLYSSELSLEPELTVSEGDTLVIEPSTVALFLFLLGATKASEHASKPFGGGMDVKVLSGSSDLDVRGPRLTPGLPRPNPLPETTEPSGSTYCLFLRDPLLFVTVFIGLLPFPSALAVTP